MSMLSLLKCMSPHSSILGLSLQGGLRAREEDNQGKSASSLPVFMDGDVYPMTQSTSKSQYLRRIGNMAIADVLYYEEVVLKQVGLNPIGLVSL